MALLSSVQKQFELHDLAIEDANHAHQRPKIEQYGDGLFIVARTAQLDRATGSRSAKPICSSAKAIWSRCATAPSTSYTAVRERCESCPRALARGEDYILYAILDFIVDNYSPVLETIHEEVEAIEDRVLANRDHADGDRTALPAAPRPAATPQRDRTPGGGLPPARARQPADGAPDHAAAVPRRHRPRPRRFRSSIDSIARGAGVRLRGEPPGRPGPGDRGLQEAARHGSPSSRSRPRSPASTG